MASLVSEPGPAVALPWTERRRRPGRRRLAVGVSGDVVAALGATLLVLETTAASHRTPTLASMLVVSLAWALCVSARHGYEDRLMHGWADEATGVAQSGLVLTVMATGAAAWVDQDVTPSDVLLLVSGTVSGSLLLRAAARAWRRMLRQRRGAVPQRLVVVGRPDDVGPLVAELNRTPGRSLDVVGVEPAALQAAIDEHTAAVVAVPCPELDPRRLRRMGWELESTGTALFVTAGLVDVARARAAVVTPGTVPLVHVRPSQLTGATRVVKEAWERFAAAIALVILTPLLLALVVAIRLDSPGPAMFRQTRVGRSEGAFTMLKFRTMHVGADQLVAELADRNESDGALFKIRDDPRVTRLGRILRRWSVDEVPQLLNVVFGHMSLVGPRPPLPAEVLLYEPDVHRRFAVKPGVTGLWQVSGRSDLSWEESARLDLRYVDNWSLGYDARILMRTARAVVRRVGAY